MDSSRPPSSSVDDLDWNQLDLALDNYTHVFELPSVHDPATAASPTHNVFHTNMKPDPAASPQFGHIPFPHSPTDDSAAGGVVFIAPADVGLYQPGDMYHHPQAFGGNNYHSVFPLDNAYPDHLIDSPTDPFLLDSPWMTANVHDIPLIGGSPTFDATLPPPLQTPSQQQQQQGVRPLMLAHRTSLPISIPSTPYRQQRFIQHSAPATYSPIRMVQERRHSTYADDAPRKRKRTPDLGGDISGGGDKDKGAPARSELHPPKQAPSTWQVFFADWLEDHRARNPRQRLNVAQAAKEAGQVYHNLKPEERERLKLRAQAAKEDREREMAEWKRKLTPDDIRRENAFRAAQRKAGKSRKGNLKDPNAPKKPLSAYFMFLQKIRSSPQLVKDVFGDETETTKQSVLAAAKWRSLSDTEKKPFLVQAEQDKIEYENARRLYEDRYAGTSIYRSTGELGHGSTTSVLAYPPFATDVATDDEGDASDGLSDP